MLGWFRPTCPVDRCAKVWIEERLEWLSKQFSERNLSTGQIILPTNQFFPDRYDRSYEAVEALLERVCGYMGVALSLVRLEIFQDGNPLWLVNEAGKAIPRAAGTYSEGSDKFDIRISSEQLGDSTALVGTMAHELAHVRLLGESRIEASAFDNEILTDLTVCFFGLGIFLANTPRVWESQFGKWPGTELIKPEYVSPPMFGYALAHLGWFREETAPAWAKYLNSAARANLKQGLKYLWKTGDSAFYPPHHTPQW
jgi:hypothetical protein